MTWKMRQIIGAIEMEEEMEEEMNKYQKREREKIPMDVGHGRHFGKQKERKGRKKGKEEREGRKGRKKERKKERKNSLNAGAVLPVRRLLANWCPGRRATPKAPSLAPPPSPPAQRPPATHPPTARPSCLAAQGYSGRAGRSGGASSGPQPIATRLDGDGQCAGREGGVG